MGVMGVVEVSRDGGGVWGSLDLGFLLVVGGLHWVGWVEGVVGLGDVEVELMVVVVGVTVGVGVAVGDHAHQCLCEVHGGGRLSVGMTERVRKDGTGEEERGRVEGWLLLLLLLLLSGLMLLRRLKPVDLALGPRVGDVEGHG